MAYVALYRSYRPKNFSEVVGQKHVIKTLKNAVTDDKTSHAYIFSGLRGIGKTTIARILAKAVNCENPIHGEPCNCCKNCMSIINEETTDIVELDAASNNGVDEMRDILEKVNFLPSLLKKKVYIIDEAHMLSTAAFNALLKTLEEPPHYVMFILATTEPHKIPQTILSRCQRFDFKQLSIEELSKEIKYVCEQENIQIDDEAINVICESAEGGMRDALGILDQASVYATDKITVEDIDSITGRISNYKLIDLIFALKEKNSTRAINIVNELIDSGKEISRVVSCAIQFCRDVLLYKSILTTTTTKPIYKSNEFQQLAKEVTEKELFYYVDMLVDIQNKIRFTNSQKIYLEVGLLKIVNLADESIDLIDKVHKIEENIKSNGGNYSVSNEIDLRLNSLDNRIRKVSTELEKAGLDDFKEKIENKVEMFEEITSKASANEQEINQKFESIETQIKTLSVSSSVSYVEEISKVSQKLKEVEEKLDQANEQPKNEIDLSCITEELNQLKMKFDNIDKEHSTQPTIDVTNILERIELVEKLIQEPIIVKQENNETSINYDEDKIRYIEDFCKQLLKEINKLSIKCKNTYISNELFTKEVDNLKENYDNIVVSLEQISKEVLENNQENNNSIETHISSQIENLKLKIKSSNEEIIKLQNSIDDLKSLKEKISLIENKISEANNKVVATKEEPKVQVNDKPKPIEIVNNENNTIQTVKNVYDIKIVERILNESWDLDCREEKNRLLSNWSKLDGKVSYVLEPIARLLRDGKLAANGKTDILIIYPSATICNNLMEPKHYNDAKQVLRMAFGRDYDFLALPENTWQEKRTEYIAQRGIGIRKPSLKPINNPELKVMIPNYNETEQVKKRPLQQAKAFFGQDVVEEEE